MLTSILLAAAIMAVLNILSGSDAISWNIFLAAIISLLPAFDKSETKEYAGSPVGHSLGFVFLFACLFGTIAMIFSLFLGFEIGMAVSIILSVSAGLAAHLFAELATGRQIFTFPRNMKFRTWVNESTAESDRFWSGWGRMGIGHRHPSDSHLNALSIGLILMCIWVG